MKQEKKSEGGYVDWNGYSDGEGNNVSYGDQSSTYYRRSKVDEIATGLPKVPRRK
jgi:hypothetical protein